MLEKTAQDQELFYNQSAAETASHFKKELSAANMHWDQAKQDLHISEHTIQVNSYSLSFS